MKQLSRSELAKRFLNLLETHSNLEAIQALAHLLIEQRMSNQVDTVVQEIGRELLERDKVLTIHVTSARPLSPYAANNIKHFFQTKTGAEHTTLIEKTDPAILGGITARALGYEIDYSLSHRLGQLEA